MIAAGTSLPDTPGGLAGALMMVVTVAGAIVGALKYRGDADAQLLSGAMGMIAALQAEVKECRAENAELRRREEAKERELRDLVRQLGHVEGELDQEKKRRQRLEKQVAQLERRSVWRDDT